MIRSADERSPAGTPLRFDAGCQFCAEFLYPRFSAPVAELLTPRSSRVIIETTNFVVVPTIGAFIAGYVLINSREHFRSIAELPQHLINELQHIRASVVSAISEEFSVADPVVFEHGSTGLPARSGKCVDHLHLNIVPVDFDASKQLTRMLGAPSQISDYAEIRAAIGETTPYVLLHHQGRMLLYEAVGVPSQLVRRLIARALRIDEWDWRAHPHLQSMLQTIDFLSAKIVLHDV
jgi:diadenosine tetraphosphate (Ap4A) HIT family hydrolase